MKKKCIIIFVAMATIAQAGFWGSKCVTRSNTNCTASMDGDGIITCSRTVYTGCNVCDTSWNPWATCNTTAPGTCTATDYTGVAPYTICVCSTPQPPRTIANSCT